MENQEFQGEANYLIGRKNTNNEKQLREEAEQEATDFYNDIYGKPIRQKTFFGELGAY